MRMKWKRWKKFFRIYSSKIVVLFFAVFFLYGCLTFDDYGLSSDEPIQRYHSLVAYNDLFLGDQEYTTETIYTEGLPTLEEYGLNYGVILQLPLVFAEHMTGFEMTYQQIYMMRHFYNFLWFFVSSIFFYKLAMILTEGRRQEALLGTMIYILCPRILADSFYNIKDLLCLSLFTISLFFGIKTVQKLSIKNIIPFVIFSALCTASRIVGGVVIAVCILVLFIKSIVEGSWKRLLKYCLGIGILFLGVFVLISPNAWNDIPGTLMKIIRTFSNYTTWNANVKYMGEWINALELPWHYLFVWIGMTVPVVYLALTLAGIVAECRSCVIKRRDYFVQNGKGWIDLTLFLTMIIPFVYVLIVRPVLYNGWRHFYFMYALIACWATVGLHRLLSVHKKLPVRIATLTALLGSFVYIVFWIALNHPYEYIYYNAWIKNYAQDNFERDYWYVSEVEALEYILDHDQSQPIEVFASQGYTWYFDGERENWMQLVSSPDVADYVVIGEEGFEQEYLFELQHEIVADGMAIRRIYHREYDVIRSFTLSLNGGESQYSLNGIRWTKDTDAEESGTVTYTAELAEAIPTDVLAVMVSDETVINGKQIEVDISNDGESWAALSEMNDYSAYGRRLSAESMIHELKYIRIRLSGVLPENLSITVLPCGYQSNVAAMGETDNPSVEDIGSNVQTDSDLRAIIDGNTGTRWETSTQQAGMYVEVSLADICTVSGVRLQLGESPWDYPRNLEIYWSVDGENWELLDAATTDNELYLFDAVECRYLRFELGETEETVTSNWSIYELELLAKVE